MAAIAASVRAAPLSTPPRFDTNTNHLGGAA